MNKKRILYADVLRIIALFAVVVLHVSAQGVLSLPTGTSGWVISTGYDSLVRFCVPVFVMISGMFFLDPNKQITLKTIYFKYIFRIVTAFIFWSLLYAIVTYGVNKPLTMDTFKKVVAGFLVGHYHLWYMFMIVGLYMVTPFLRLITQRQSKSLIQYFLLLWIIFSLVVPLLLNIPQLALAKTILKYINLNLILGYVGYYLAGYYFHTYELTKSIRRVIYIGGGIGFASTFALTVGLSWNKENNLLLFGNLTPNVMLSSVAVFVLIKELVERLNMSEKATKLIASISSYTFGAYLVHAFILQLIRQFGFIVDESNAIYIIPIEAIITFVISLSVTYILSKNRILKKYIL